MKTLITIGMFAIFFASIICTVTCDNDGNDGDSEDDQPLVDDFDDDDTAADCQGNHPPEIWGIKVSVNGNEVNMPVIVHDDDTIAVSFEYRDLDCNLDGGYIWLPANETSGVTITDAGCSSNEAGHPYVVGFLADFFTPDVTPLNMEVCDSCHDQKCDKVVLEIEMEYNQ